MKANELMIGDWICYKGRTQIPVRVVSFNNQTIKFDNGTPQDWMSTIENFEPIPLTEEILKKNGFGYKEEDDYLSHYYLGDKCYLSNPDLHIGTSNKGVYWLNYWYNAIYGIKYVHQLQHALQLCGIGNEIEL